MADSTQSSIIYLLSSPMNALLALRSLLFLILLPGTVAGYIPFRILRGSGQLFMPPLSVSAVLAGGVGLAGVCVLLRCVWDFFAAGRGTPRAD